MMKRLGGGMRTNRDSERTEESRGGRFNIKTRGTKDTKEGEKDVYRLARQSDRGGKDVQQVIRLRIKFRRSD